MQVHDPANSCCTTLLNFTQPSILSNFPHNYCYKFMTDGKDNGLTIEMSTPMSRVFSDMRGSQTQTGIKHV